MSANQQYEDIEESSLSWVTREKPCFINLSRHTARQRETDCHLCDL